MLQVLSPERRYRPGGVPPRTPSARAAAGRTRATAPLPADSLFRRPFWGLPEEVGVHKGLATRIVRLLCALCRH
ncbi:hypothetical protein GCM10009549_29310 [Streptomyces thermoalcalitolerans]|uniref:Uncharacterized protein n=1 Tax=Streptomyces thermoalcalitolerans TaxID=65605 RepID=A0ABN1NQZ9_9ACTN